jgi:RNA polymerase sigma factor (sigma-70 family)
MSELSDQCLLRAYCGGDRAAFDALFRRYAARVYATAWRLTGHWEDAEDTLQEVFIRLAEKASTIRHEGALSAWLYRAAVNRAVDLLRRRRKAVSLDENSLRAARVIVLESLRREAARQESGRRERLLAQVGSMIPRLPPRQGAVLVLRGFQGLTHREIALILDCTEASSKSTYSLACGRIRDWIAQEDARENRTKTRGENRS